MRLDSSCRRRFWNDLTPPPEPMLKMKQQSDGVARFIKDMNKNQKPGWVSSWGLRGCRGVSMYRSVTL